MVAQFGYRSAGVEFQVIKTILTLDSPLAGCCNRHSCCLIAVSFFGAIWGVVSIAGRTEEGLSSAFEVVAFTQ
jgi:hypothetical protein